LLSDRDTFGLGFGRRALVVVAAASVAVLVPVAVSSASAGGKRVTGRLNASGYTVIALGYNGKAAISKARSFSLPAPASMITLQLVNRHTGKYAGPVVVGGKGSRVIVGFKAGAKLGEIDVISNSGYARTAKPLAKRWLDDKRFAQAHKGVPIGNGRNFGFVRSKMLGGGRGLGQDYDHSGVPNAFNVAENGDLVLNNLEPPSRLGRSVLASAAQATTTNGFQTATSLSTFIGQGSLNADAANVSPDDIANVMENQMGLYMNVVPGTATYLDCNGLSWCALGGSGHLYAAGSTGITPSCTVMNNCGTAAVTQLWGPKFPECCSANASGLGDILNSATTETGPNEFALAPGACPQSPPTPAQSPPCPTTDQIGTGDALIQDVTDSSGAVTPIPGTIGFVFTTTPGLDSWSSGSDSATVSYPVTPGDPGTQSNPWMISLPGSGDLVLGLTFWRPQRSPIPAPPDGVGGDPCLQTAPACNWIDIGGLTYSANPFLSNGPGAGGGVPSPVNCPQSAYTTTDPELVPATGPTGGGGGLTDTASDMPSSPANTLSFSEDLTACFAAGGVTLQSGDVIKVPLFARDASSDQASTGFTFKIR
jgi:hypothetical protein